MKMVSQSHTATILLFTTSLFIFRSISAVHSLPRLNATANDLDFIRTSCNATLYQDLCFSSLAGYASVIQDSPARLASVATGVSLSKAKATLAFLSKLSRSLAEVKDCVSYLDEAVDSIRDSLRTLRNMSRGSGVAAAAPTETFSSQVNDVQTWMSAALTYEDTCTDEYEEMDGAGEVKTTVYDRVNTLKRFTSNALALVNNYGNNGTPRDEIMKGF